MKDMVCGRGECGAGGDWQSLLVLAEKKMTEINSNTSSSGDHFASMAVTDSSVIATRLNMISRNRNVFNLRAATLCSDDLSKSEPMYWRLFNVKSL